MLSSSFRREVGHSMKGIWLAGCLLTAGAARADASFTLGEWSVAYAVEGQSLRLVHAPSGAEIAGDLVFTVDDHAEKGKADGVEWRIVDARDGAPRRLSVVDSEDAVRASVAFRANGAEIAFLICPGADAGVCGELSYAGEIRYRSDAFAASTLPFAEERVLQLASGDPDSEICDSLFSPGRDEALQLRVSNLRLTAADAGSHAFECAGRIQKVNESTFSFAVERDYYRSRWLPNYRPIGLGAKPSGVLDVDTSRVDVARSAPAVRWEHVLRQARATVDALPAHGIAAWSDPGCLFVSQRGLAKEQARVETTVVALPGQRVFADARPQELAPDRLRMLRQSVPACAVRPLSLYPCLARLSVWNLHLKRAFGDWHVVAIFNWDDLPAVVGFDWGEIGEPVDRAFVCWEFWTESWQGVNLERFEMQVPPRSVRLLALQPYSAHPQFLTSDRHVTQGGVELKDQRWGDDRLDVTLEVPGDLPVTVRFSVPDSFAFKSLDVPAGVKAVTRAEAGGKVLAVTLTSARTRDVALALHFQ